MMFTPGWAAKLLGITDQNRKWWILFATGIAGGLILLDETVVGTAIPTIRKDLGMSAITSHWVINTYMLVFAAFAAAGGRLADILGFRVLIPAGAALFGIASLVAGFADGPTVLIATRTVQGMGAAVYLPATLAMVTVAFPKEQRGMALGIFAAIGTGFMAAGPLVGGFLTEIVSWRWVFWINVPITAAIALIVGIAWFDPPRIGRRPAFDNAGLVTLAGGLGLLIFAVMQAGDWGWTQPVILACLAGGVAVLGMFVVIENRRDMPLLEVDLFRIPAFTACALVMFAAQFTKITIVVFGALYLQDKLGMSPLTAGLALLLSVAAFPILSAPVGRLADKHGARPFVLGGWAVATLMNLWIAVATTWDNYWLIGPGLLVWGTGLVICYVPVFKAMSNAVPKEKQGQGSGVGMSARLLGGTVGVAVSSTLLVSTESFQIIFLSTTAVMFVTLVLAWLMITDHEE